MEVFGWVGEEGVLGLGCWGCRCDVCTGSLFCLLSLVFGIVDIC